MAAVASAHPDDVLSIREQVSEEEWETRVNLAACYRLVDHYDMSDLLGTHISARVPGEDNTFLLNPYGMYFDEITASSLIKVDYDGNVLTETPFDLNLAGFTIHSAVMMGRPDAYARWYGGFCVKMWLASHVSAFCAFYRPHRLP